MCLRVTDWLTDWLTGWLNILNIPHLPTTTTTEKGASFSLSLSLSCSLFPLTPCNPHPPIKRSDLLREKGEIYNVHIALRLSAWCRRTLCLGRLLLRAAWVLCARVFHASQKTIWLIIAGTFLRSRVVKNVHQQTASCCHCCVSLTLLSSVRLLEAIDGALNAPADEDENSMLPFFSDSCVSCCLLSCNEDDENSGWIVAEWMPYRCNNRRTFVATSM